MLQIYSQNGIAFIQLGTQTLIGLFFSVYLKMPINFDSFSFVNDAINAAILICVCFGSALNVVCTRVYIACIRCFVRRSRVKAAFNKSVHWDELHFHAQLRTVRSGV